MVFGKGEGRKNTCDYFKKATVVTFDRVEPSQYNLF